MEGCAADGQGLSLFDLHAAEWRPEELLLQHTALKAAISTDRTGNTSTEDAAILYARHDAVQRRLRELDVDDKAACTVCAAWRGEHDALRAENNRLQAEALSLRSAAARATGQIEHMRYLVGELQESVRRSSQEVEQVKSALKRKTAECEQLRSAASPAGQACTSIIQEDVDPAPSLSGGSKSPEASWDAIAENSPSADEQPEEKLSEFAEVWEGTAADGGSGMPAIAESPVRERGAGQLTMFPD